MQAKQTTKDRLYWIVALSLGFLAGLVAALIMASTPDAVPWWLPILVCYIGFLAVVLRVTR